MDMLSRSASDLIPKEQAAISELLSLQKAEESFLKQKSRVKDVTDGDQNTRYFHLSSKVRTTYNTIRHITTSTGKVLTDPDEIVGKFVGFYKSLLGTEDAAVSHPSVSELKSILNGSRTTEKGFDIYKFCTKDEVRRVMFHMDGARTPGPDGYSTNFYKSTWTS
ncbi:hypothetical protein LINPERPRIM_LOCUS38700 [Linum perenne]